MQGFYLSACFLSIIYEWYEWMTWLASRNSIRIGFECFSATDCWPGYLVWSCRDELFIKDFNRQLSEGIFFRYPWLINMLATNRTWMIYSPKKSKANNKMLPESCNWIFFTLTWNPRLKHPSWLDWLGSVIGHCSSNFTKHEALPIFMHNNELERTGWCSDFVDYSKIS